MHLIKMPPPGTYTAGYDLKLQNADEWALAMSTWARIKAKASNRLRNTDETFATIERALREERMALVSGVMPKCSRSVA